MTKDITASSISYVMDILKRHNSWRRGDDSEPIRHNEIGYAIDRAVELLGELHSTVKEVRILKAREKSLTEVRVLPKVDDSIEINLYP